MANQKKEITIVDVQKHFLEGEYQYSENLKKYILENINDIDKINIVVDMLFEQSEDSNSEDVFYDIENYLIETKYELEYKYIRKLEESFNIDLENIGDIEDVKEVILEELEEQELNYEYFDFTEQEFEEMMDLLDEMYDISVSINEKVYEYAEELNEYTSKNIPLELAIFYKELEEEHVMNIGIRIEKEYNYYRTVLDYAANGHDNSNKTEKFPYFLKLLELIPDFREQDLEELYKSSKKFKQVMNMYIKEEDTGESLDDIFQSFNEMSDELYESIAVDSEYHILNKKNKQVFIGGGAEECLLEEAVNFKRVNDLEITFHKPLTFGNGDVEYRFEPISDKFDEIQEMLNNKSNNISKGSSIK